MDHRCPVCGADLRKRKLTQAVVARWEIECTGCNSTIRLNIHRVEATIVVLSFGTFVALAAFAHKLQSEELMLYAFAVAMAGASALPLLEHTYLRTWPRYASRGHSANP